jgi:hypothetical protein
MTGKILKTGTSSAAIVGLVLAVVMLVYTVASVIP